MAMNPKDLLVWIKSLARGQALPLDASEVHESLKAAQDYAGTAIAYGGQTVKVKLDDGKYHEYILQPSGDGYQLEEIRGGGSAGIHVGDESSMPEGTVLHIDPDGEGYEMIELDTTLSKAGYAADANVTGKKIDELHERLENVEQNGSGTSIDEIYILGEEETVDDAPDTAKEIIDPYDDAKPVDLGQFATKEDLRELSGEAGESPQDDWNQNDETAKDYIKNRTHYDTRYSEVIEYEFDGDLSNKDVVVSEPITYIKISDDALPMDAFIGGSLRYVYDGQERSEYIIDGRIAPYEPLLGGEPNEVGVYNILGYILVNRNDAFPVDPEQSLGKGTWAITFVIDDVILDYPISITTRELHKGELKTIDAKYLPVIPADWNQDDADAQDYVKHRTHYDTRKVETITVEFDGNIGSKEYINQDASTTLVKISDKVCPITCLKEFNYCIYVQNESTVSDMMSPSENNTEVTDNSYVIGSRPAVFRVVTRPFRMGGYILTPGIWAIINKLAGTDMVYGKSCSFVDVPVGELKKLDPKFLPDELNTEGLRTTSIKEAINFPASFKVRSGTKALEVEGILSQGTYGVLKIDTLPVFHCYLAESATYSLTVRINDEIVAATITGVTSERVDISVDGYGSLYFIANTSNYQVGVNSSIPTGTKLYVCLVYAEDYSGATLLTDEDVTKGGTSPTNLEGKLTTDTKVAEYLLRLLPYFKYTSVKEMTVEDGSTSVYINLHNSNSASTGASQTLKLRTLFKYGVLPDGCDVKIGAGEYSIKPYTDTDDMVLFTWGDVPGTVKVTSTTQIIPSTAHTLIKNFDSFEANTTYLIWVRAHIVFAFKAETLPEEGLIIT